MLLPDLAHVSSDAVRLFVMALLERVCAAADSLFMLLDSRAELNNAAAGINAADK